MDENDTPPEDTSGTPESVVLEVSQVMRDWIWVTTSATSWGSTWLPMTKQLDPACRSETMGADGNVSFQGNGKADAGVAYRRRRDQRQMQER